MKIIRTIAEMQQQSLAWKRDGHKVSVVPTMGALHPGHLSLVDEVKKYSDKVIVTIFVNPTQFAPGEDLDAYPRTFEADRQACEERGVDAIFFPTNSAMYFNDATTWVNEEKLSQGLCAQSRPTHFQGVTTVVTKLYNATLPDVAIFGEKDFQQLAVLKRMTRDLNFPIEVLTGKLIREEDGLAMSSRNTYLSKEERQNALSIFQSLTEARQLVKSGEIESKKILSHCRSQIEQAGGKIDYLEIRNSENLELKTDSISKEENLHIIVAAFFGKTRLLDNMSLT